MARELADAFPSAVRNDACIAVARFLSPEEWHFWRQFSVRVAGEMLAIPERVYSDPVDLHGLSELQREIIDCLMTRNHNGYVRQRHLEKIIRSTNAWTPPFVIRLVGEYVIDEQRVMSYWNEYHRAVRGYIDLPIFKRDEYVGFRLMRFFKSLAEDGRPN